jgi:hypothetical protein
MFQKETNLDKIKEFFELNDKIYELRKFTKPALVYIIDDDKVKYSLWEEDILDRFGLKNVDGWDATEDLIFCPDWLQHPDEFDDDEDIDLDEDD